MNTWKFLAFWWCMSSFFFPGREVYNISPAINKKMRSQWTNYLELFDEEFWLKFGPYFGWPLKIEDTWVLGSRYGSCHPPPPQKMACFPPLVGFDHCYRTKKKSSPKPPRAKVPGLTRLLRAVPPWFVRMAQLKRTWFFVPLKTFTQKAVFTPEKGRTFGFLNGFWGGPYDFGGSPCWFYYSSFYDTKNRLLAKDFRGQRDRHKLSTGSFLVVSSNLGIWDFNVCMRLALSFFSLERVGRWRKIWRFSASFD